MRRYEGRSVVVTGAGQGIGAAYARAFADEGASVVVADVNGSAAEVVARSIPGALPVTVDVADEVSVERMAERTAEAFGGIDVLVNNAGLHLGKYNLTSTLALADWRRLFDVNVFGAVLCARACRPHLSKRGRGVILNQSSSSAYGGNGAYAVSKLALNGITRQLVKRFGALEDLLGMVLLLCSDEASLISGETVLVDGGFVRRI